MPKTVRVGDTVNYMQADGQMTTAVVTNVDTQDQVDIEFYEPQHITVADVARATTQKPAAGTFTKSA